MLRKKIGITIIIALGLIKINYAQSLQIISNEREEAYPVEDIQKITFENREANIYLKDNSEVNVFNLELLQNMNFEEVLSHRDNFNLLADEFVLYPNPVSDVLHIHLDSGVSLNIEHVQIFNLNGKIIYNHRIDYNNKTEYSINISQLPKGVYLCEIHYNNTKSTKKIIKK